MATVAATTTHHATTMKALVRERYGPPDVLELVDVEKQAPADDGVLVRVRATSVNRVDWYVLTGIPYVARPMTGLLKPKSARLGGDFAGTVEAVGRDVTDLAAGDEVFGVGDGAFAEYVCAGAGIAPKPRSVTFEEAAAVPIAGLTALQGLRDHGRLRPGQHVLINGASGGVGTFAVQIAKALGAEVTGVSSTKNLDLVRSIGADHVIDYTQEDFTKAEGRYDLILDNVGKHSMARTRRALKPTGTLISNGGGHADGKLGRTIRTMLVSMFVSQQASPTVKTQNHDDLVALKALVEAGKITPVIDGTYPLAETRKAIERVATGRTRGTIVIDDLERRQAAVITASVATEAPLALPAAI